VNRLPVALITAAGVGLAAWQGVSAYQRAATPDPEVAAPVPVRASASPAPTVPKPDARAAAPSTSATPMAQRVAVLGVLNKRNGLSRDIRLTPGQAVRLGDLVVRLRACEETAPWEAEHLTGAFVQANVHGQDGRWRRVFSGWLYKESPSLNVVQHPIYDVWPKSCTMRHPEMGPETIMAGSGGVVAPSRRSRAVKSPIAPVPEDDGANAESSNAT